MKETEAIHALEHDLRRASKAISVRKRELRHDILMSKGKPTVDLPGITVKHYRDWWRRIVLQDREALVKAETLVEQYRLLLKLAKLGLRSLRTKAKR